jgi:hypothetical protein
MPFRFRLDEDELKLGTLFELYNKLLLLAAAFCGWPIFWLVFNLLLLFKKLPLLLLAELKLFETDNIEEDEFELLFRLFDELTAAAAVFGCSLLAVLQVFVAADGVSFGLYSIMSSSLRLLG